MVGGPRLPGTPLLEQSSANQHRRRVGTYPSGDWGVDVTLPSPLLSREGKLFIDHLKQTKLPMRHHMWIERIDRGQLPTPNNEEPENSPMRNGSVEPWLGGCLEMSRKKPFVKRDGTSSLKDDLLLYSVLSA